MAYEISEGAAAAAMFLSDTEYKACETGDEEAVIKVMGKIHANLDNVEMSGGEEVKYKAWFDTTELDTVISNKGKDSKLTAVNFESLPLFEMTVSNSVVSNHALYFTSSPPDISTLSRLACIFPITFITASSSPVSQALYSVSDKNIAAAAAPSDISYAMTPLLL